MILANKDILFFNIRILSFSSSPSPFIHGTSLPSKLYISLIYSIIETITHVIILINMTNNYETDIESNSTSKFIKVLIESRSLIFQGIYYLK